ncbi:MAG: hypothetical protein P4M11_10035 [Candidatus Pacebacteria bacterium]|jgi:hypothetical protein|nr:hypothetical protein [Candidatus Paceibacterota bacterium]
MVTHRFRTQAAPQEKNHNCNASWKPDEADYEALMHDVLQVTGLDRNASFADRTLLAWLKRGFTPDLIMAVLKAKVPTSKINKLAWWKAVLEEVCNAQ